MEDRLKAVMTELEDINYILQNACVDPSILQLLGKLGEGDPEVAVGAKVGHRISKQTQE